VKSLGAAPTPSLHRFLKLVEGETVPDHSTLSVTRSRLPQEVHHAVFGFILEIADRHARVRGKRIGVDASTQQANDLHPVWRFFRTLRGCSLRSRTVWPRQTGRNSKGATKPHQNPGRLPRLAHRFHVKCGRTAIPGEDHAVLYHVVQHVVICFGVLKSGKEFDPAIAMAQ
jgi:hypothetical protein